MYNLNCVTYVPRGVTLTIKPGTMVQAKLREVGDNAAVALVVHKGGRIVANGTVEDPIPSRSPRRKTSTTTGPRPERPWRAGCGAGSSCWVRRRSRAAAIERPRHTARHAATSANTGARTRRTTPECVEERARVAAVTKSTKLGHARNTRTHTGGNNHAQDERWRMEDVSLATGTPATR